MVSRDWLMMTLERRRDLVTVLEPYFLPKRPHSTKSSARDLQAFLVFSQHPVWVITPVNP